MSPGWEDLWVPTGSRLGQDPLEQWRDPGSGEGRENAGTVPVLCWPKCCLSHHLGTGTPSCRDKGSGLSRCDPMWLHPGPRAPQVGLTPCWGDRPSQLAWDSPGLSTESSVSPEAPHSWALWDGWSPPSQPCPGSGSLASPTLPISAVSSAHSPRP